MGFCSKFLLTAFLFFAPTLSWGESTWTVDLTKGEGHVDFHAIGRPKAIKIHGKGAHPSGELIANGKVVKGIATFDLKSLDSGIETRDDHMKNKYLEVKKFPSAKLEITELALGKLTPADFSKEKIPFKGKLSLHGKTQEVKGDADLKKSGEKLNGHIGFSITLSQYGIDIPSFSGITVANEVELEVEFTAPIKFRK